MLVAYDQSIEEISRSIFTAMLGAELCRLDAPLSDTEEGSVRAIIHIAGAWTGCVTISLDSALARFAAASMLGADEASVSDEDIHDTATELANMVGGNLKSLLPGPSFLSLPALLPSDDPGLRPCEAELLEDLHFASEHGVFNVRFFQKRPERG